MSWENPERKRRIESILRESAQRLDDGQEVDFGRPVLDQSAAFQERVLPVLTQLMLICHELNVPFLGEVPINMQIRITGDAGRTADNFTDPACAPYLERICRQLVTNIALSAAARSGRQPLPVL